jgi:DNA-binding winged helix-turn-helix (wHTH) protein/Tfp pilus assembly protein PilF
MRNALLFPYHRQVTGSATICFDGWTVNLSSGELSRGGHVQRLAPQPLAMLAELLAHPGEVVPRERMVQVLWPRGVVDFDNSLNAVVRKLRVVLGDEADAPRYIETLPRIGFRFVGTLEQATPPEGSQKQSGGRRTAVLSAVATAMGALLAAIALWWFNRSDTEIADAGSAVAAQISSKRSTNERARELYLQARFHVSRRDIDGTDLAVASLESALREDPYFAEGWATLAEVWAGAGMTLKVPVSDAYDKARKAALRALELDDQLSDAHSALGHILTHFDRDFAGADAELARALQLDARNAPAWHSVALLRAYQGRMPEAFEAIRRARELEPTRPLFNQNYGMLLFHSRRYDEAIAHARSLLASQPRFDQARSVLIRALVARGEVDAALEQLALRQTDRLSMSDAGLAYAHAGRRDAAQAEITRLESLERQGFGMAYDMAVIHAALGEGKSGCKALERALADHSLTLPWMRLDPRMDSLRRESCFTGIQNKVYRE